MASRSPGKFRSYRWKEFGLLIIPFLVLLLAMTQLLLANVDPQSSLNVRNLPTIQGLIPVIGLIAALVAVCAHNIVDNLFVHSMTSLFALLIIMLIRLEKVSQTNSV